jgi:16S rRNA (guanine966-N2)-methyltransferase
VREALFNILAHHDWHESSGGLVCDDPLKGARVLDAFAGTGALGIEAISRGAFEALFLEKDRKALVALNANIEKMGISLACRVFTADATRPLIKQGLEPCSLIFLDPPYGKGLAEQALVAAAVLGLVGQGALIVLETAKKEAGNLPESARALLSRTYGDTTLHFYAWDDGFTSGQKVCEGQKD